MSVLFKKYIISFFIKYTEIKTHIKCIVSLSETGKLLMSSIRETIKRKKIDSKKTNHFVLIVFSMKKYNEIEIIMDGIKIMPPPLGIDLT
tara:strand:+ start:271 stop:540 length:270 start_codon:yes stop_codon:yes gene_type:complete